MLVQHFQHAIGFDFHLTGVSLELDVLAGSELVLVSMRRYMVVLSGDVVMGSKTRLHTCLMCLKHNMEENNTFAYFNPLMKFDLSLSLSLSLILILILSLSLSLTLFLSFSLYLSIYVQMKYESTSDMTPKVPKSSIFFGAVRRQIDSTPESMRQIPRSVRRACSAGS